MKSIKREQNKKLNFAHTTRFHVFSNLINDLPVPYARSSHFKRRAHTKFRSQ